MYVWSLNLLKELVEATLKSSPHQGAGILHGGRHGGRSRSNNNTPKRAGRSDGGPDDETDHSRRKSPRNHHHDPYGRSTTPTRSTINTTNSGMALPPLVVLSLSLCEPAAKRILMPDSYILATTEPDGGTPSRRRSANSSRAPSRSGTPSKTRKGGGGGGGNVSSTKQNIYGSISNDSAQREQQSFSYHAAVGSKHLQYLSTLTSEQPKAHEDYTTDPSSISFVTDAYTTHDEAEAEPEAAGVQKATEARQLNYSSQDSTAINTINKDGGLNNKIGEDDKVSHAYTSYPPAMITPRRPRSYSTLLIGRSVVDPAAVVFEAHFASANTIVLINRYGHVYYGVLPSCVEHHSSIDSHKSFFVCVCGGNEKTPIANEENNAAAANTGEENEMNSADDRKHKKVVSSTIRATCLATAPSVSDELAFIGYSDLSIRAISLKGPNIVFVLPPPSAPASPLFPSQDKFEETATDSLLGEVSRPLRFFGASPYGPFMYFAHAFGVVIVKVVATKHTISDRGTFRSEGVNGAENEKTNDKQEQNSDKSPALPRFSIAATHYSAKEISIGDPSQGEEGEGCQAPKLFAVVPIDRSLAALLYDTNDCFLVDFGYLRSNPEKFIVSSCLLGDEDPDVAIQNSMDFAKTTVVPQVAVDTSLVLGVDAMGPLCWQVGLTKI